MRLKVTLERPAGAIDLVLTVDATATAGDVARMLVHADPTGTGDRPAAVTLEVSDGHSAASARRVLDASVTIADANVLSGSRIAVVDADERFIPGHRGTSVAQVRVLAGPDAGREFSIPAGSSTIGRDREADIRLADPLVSKVHARLNVADGLEIIDLNSANGVLMGGDIVARAQLGPSDIVVLGDTSLSVVRLQQPPHESSAPQVDHVRSPRVVSAHRGGEHPAPTPPKLPQRQRFPLLALMAPLLIGLVLWVITQQLLGVVMMAMSPLLLVGAYIDQTVTARRQVKAERKSFDEAMLSTQERLSAIRDEERRARMSELVPTAQLLEDARRLGPMLWSERPESPTFLTLSAGMGRQASRNTVAIPAEQNTIPECWEQLLGLALEFSTVDDVPIPIELRSAGSLGIAGPGPVAVSVARALVFQAIARHSPTELVVAGVLSTSVRAEWEWLKWVPHTSSSHSPIGVPHLADTRGAASRLLGQLEGVIDSRLDGAPGLRPPIDPGHPDDPPEPRVPAVLVLIDNAAAVDRARLTRIVERGPDAGIHVIWCAPRVEQLPAGCRSFVIVESTGQGGVVGQVRKGERTMPVRLETLELAEANAVARALAPVVDVGVPEADDSDLPRAVSYPSLIGAEVLDQPESVVDRWRQNQSLVRRDGAPAVPRKKAGGLRAIIGHAGSEPFALDLRADGPHALVGGTTGAGKSEFLQSWVLGMAAAHSPDRLTFLFVDYKGGSAFADCVDLPHTVGLVTDLSPHLVRRALTSLKAELRHREHVLNAKKAKDLVSLEKSGDPDCPPSLVIVVDEFAALVQEVPEFVDGVVDVAQRGRSLGLHLILATQRPSGVIKDNLRANTNLRVALRMADAEDSMDILGDRMAAYFDPAVPGRGAAKTGPGRIRAFQTGYAGGHTTGEPPRPQIDVEELDFGSHVAWEAPEVETPDAAEGGPSDIARIVATVRAAAADVGVPAPRKPWLEELASIYSLSRLPNPRSDDRLPLGVLDHPASQSQPTTYYEPDRDGNLAVFGTGGSGKSTVLRTIAVAAAATARNGGPTHVYGLDFGSRGLSMLDELPHVGAIVSGDDEERVIRTIRMLRDIVDDRAVKYAAVNAGSIGQYRAQANAPDEPRILLLVDGVGAFKEQYEFGPAHLSAWFTAFAQIAADGRGVGVHIVMTGDRPNSLPNSIASTVQRRIVLRLAHEDEYLMLGVPRDILTPASPPGRGILDGDEIQIAIFGDSGNVAVQAREMKRLAATLGRGSSGRPAPVLRLPEQVRLVDLPAGSPGAPVIGLDDVTLGAAVLSVRGSLLLAGPPGSGRTTALDTFAAAIARTSPETRTVLLSPRRSILSRRPWHESAEGADRVMLLASRLISSIEAGDAARYALFVEAVPEFTGSDAEYELDRLIKLLIREEHFVVGEGETSTWSQAYTLGQPFKAGRRGLLLAPGEMDGEMLVGTPLGRVRRSDFNPGRGFLIATGRATKVQIAQDAR